MGHKELVAKNKFDFYKMLIKALIIFQDILNSKIPITVLAAFNFG